MTRAGQDELRRDRRARIRRRAAVALVVITCLAVLGSTVGVWARRTALNTDRFVALVAPLAQEPDVQRAMANYLTDRVFDAVDVETRIRSALLEAGLETGVLAGPIADGARGRAREAVEAFLGSDAFQRLWVRALTAGHRTTVALLRDQLEPRRVVVESGEVRLNLIPVVAEALRRVVEGGLELAGDRVTIPTISPDEPPTAARARLSAALDRALPPDFGELTVMSEDRLATAQAAVRTFESLVWWMMLASLFLVGATLATSTDRRRTLIQIGLGVTVTMILAASFIRRIEEAILDAAAGADERTVREVLGTTVGSLRSLGLFVVMAALVVTVSAYLAGRPRWIDGVGSWARDRMDAGAIERWTARHGDGLKVTGYAVAAAVLFLTGIDWLPVLIVVGALAVFLWIIRTLEASFVSKQRGRLPETHDPTDSGAREPTRGGRARA